jgi:micrococcal nuclease
MLESIKKGLSSIYTKKVVPVIEESISMDSVDTILEDDISLDYGDCVPYMPLQDGAVVYVCKVYDGDTVTISWLDKSTHTAVRIGCRINGIDTPELRGSSAYEKELAYQAKDRLLDKVMGEFVIIRNPALEKYGRVLADLEIGDCPSIKDYMLEAPGICKPYDGGKKRSWDQ